MQLNSDLAYMLGSLLLWCPFFLLAFIMPAMIGVSWVVVRRLSISTWACFKNRKYVSTQVLCFLAHGLIWIWNVSNESKSMLNTKGYGKAPSSCYITFENDCVLLCGSACSPQASHGTTFATHSLWTNWKRIMALTTTATWDDGVHQSSYAHTPS